MYFIINTVILPILCYSFKYIARTGTPAANLQAALVSDQIASERLSRFQAVINESQAAFNKSCEGLVMPILFDRKGKKPGQLSGRSPYFQSVYVEGNERLIGSIQNVKITNGFDNSLTGQLELLDGVVNG